ncbi:hypothetical protein D9M72_475270 [compost metagenome]
MPPRIDPPPPLDPRLPAIGERHLDRRRALGSIARHLRVADRSPGKRPMQRVARAVRAALDRLRMADMLGAAGEEKAGKRPVDPDIAVRGDRGTRRQVDAIDDEGGDVERGKTIEQHMIPLAVRRFFERSQHVLFLKSAVESLQSQSDDI